MKFKHSDESSAFLCENRHKLSFSSLLSVIISVTTMLQHYGPSAVGPPTAAGDSLCFILLAVNSSWDDNSRASALIIFLCLQERYCFFSVY